VIDNSGSPTAAADGGKKYRIRVQYKNWIGRPDPSGMGKYYLYSDDPAWLHDAALLRQRWGDKVLATERNCDGEWVPM